MVVHKYEIPALTGLVLTMDRFVLRNRFGDQESPESLICTCTTQDAGGISLKYLHDKMYVPLLSLQDAAH